MYVNTLITLQENLATYAMEGKKVSGHVTINSPGIIKCYIQNLKGQGSGHEYTFYAFSKTQNKGVRIGSLSTQKETKWKVSEKNVGDSGLKLEDLDAVAIVAENGMRGADTVAMGFKNNRYIIIPLIDDILKQKLKTTQTTEQKVLASPEIVNHKNMVKPDHVKEGDCPIQKQTNKWDTKEIKQGNMTSQGSQTGQWNSANQGNMAGQGNMTSQGSQTGQWNSANQGDIAGQGNMTSQGSQTGQWNPANQGNIAGQGNMTSQGSQAGQWNPANQGNMTSQANQSNQGNMASQEDGGYEGIISAQESQEDMTTLANQGNMTSQANGGYEGIISAQESQEDMNEQQGSFMQQQYMTDQDMEVIYPSTNNDNTTGTEEHLEDSNVSKKQILEEGHFKDIIPTEKIEDTEAELKKIAEMLQEVEKEPSIKKVVKSGKNYSAITSTASTASTVREDKVITDIHEIERMADKASEELNDIINRLKADQEIKDKLSEIEKQIEAISKIPQQTQRTINQCNIEKTLETQYISKQDRVTEKMHETELIEKIEEVEEDIEVRQDTSPRNAIKFIKNCLNNFMNKKVEDKQQSISEEVDYINEIDRKIKEIEERRKCERDK